MTDTILDEGGHRGGLQIPTLQAVDALRARELNALSQAAREGVLYDLHGVSDLKNEISLPEKLAELDRRLQYACQDAVIQSQAYTSAMHMNQSYGTDKSFRLSFLRADLFDCELAARRILQFFERKLELFGPEVLCRDIQQNDLNESDLQLLRSGEMQLLSQKDQAGRRILCHVSSDESCVRSINLLRTMFYMTMSAVEETDTQRKGLVSVVFSTAKYGAAGKWETASVDRFIRLREALPVRYVGMHYCTNDCSSLERANYEICSLDSLTKAKCRVHEVSAMEARYVLASFGIARESIPLTIRGKIKIEDHECWIQDRLFKEKKRSCHLNESQTTTSASQEALLAIVPTDPSVSSQVELVHNSGASQPQAVIPTPYDVLFGRGKVKKHPGNVILHLLVNDRRDRYEIAEKWEKTVVAEEIVSIIRDHTGRFLRLWKKDDKKSWVVVNPETAREKVSHTFRSGRPKTGMVHAKVHSVATNPKRCCQVFGYSIPISSICQED